MVQPNQRILFGIQIDLQLLLSEKFEYNSIYGTICFCVDKQINIFVKKKSGQAYIRMLTVVIFGWQNYVQFYPFLKK